MTDQEKGALVLSKALARVGEHEVPMGSNRGPLPDKALTFVQCALGNPWCAAYLCLNVHDAGLVGPRTASTGEVHEWALAHGKVIYDPRTGAGNPANILPGDAGLCTSDTSPTGFHHTTMARLKPSGGEVATVEGNESDQVMLHSRALAECVWVRPYL